MSRFERALKTLAGEPRTWLVTGCAGFIGSHLLETLLANGQRVTGLDNFATGSSANLEDVHARVGDEAWARFRFIEGDIVEPDACREACAGADYVLHQAALGSVPRSISDPAASHRANVDGFVQVLIAARDAGVNRVVYASSSSVYGDEPGLPKVEDRVGRPLSPYAATKAINETYARVFHRCYGLEIVGLRYFNVFGPRQDPDGPYAAVIPRWVGQLLDGQTCTIHGDGETSRDFCYVANAVQANVMAAIAEAPDVCGEVFNVAVGARTTLNELFAAIRDCLAAKDRPGIASASPTHGPFREGDIRHSLASIDRARERLGYRPTHTLADGLREAIGWYVANAGGRRTEAAGSAIPA